MVGDGLGQTQEYIEVPEREPVNKLAQSYGLTVPVSYNSLVYNQSESTD